MVLPCVGQVEGFAIGDERVVGERLPGRDRRRTHDLDGPIARWPPRSRADQTPQIGSFSSVRRVDAVGRGFPALVRRPRSLCQVVLLVHI